MWLSLMSKEFTEWQKDNQRHDGKVNSMKDKGMTKEVMAWKVWWCVMYGEAGKTHNGVMCYQEVNVVIWHHSGKIWQLCETLETD